MIVGAFTRATSNNSIFTDSSSNDLIINTQNLNQRLLIGFSNRYTSSFSIGNSNIIIGTDSSNISIKQAGNFVSTGNLDISKNFTSSNAYITNTLGIGSSTFDPLAHSNLRLYVAGTARLEGDLIVNGNIESINTNVTLTDEFRVVNNGTGPAFLVNQLGATPIATFQTLSNQVVLITNDGKVAIGNQTPLAALDVKGDTFIRGNLNLSNISGSNSYFNFGDIKSNLTVGIQVTTPSAYLNNLYLGNKLIIDNSGVITNSNYIPTLDTTKIQYGTFTSNYIQDYNIISQKLSSNLTIAGKTYIDGVIGIGTSNPAFGNPYVKLKVEGGDALITGQNNFSNLGHQARLYMGNSSYFIAASCNVGIVMQVPNTTYPFVLEENSGFLGLGVTDPEERLHVAQNAKIGNNLYTMNRMAVGHSNPIETVSILGNMSLSNFGKIVVSTSNNYLGVNNSTPTARLHVGHPSSGDAFLVNNPSDALTAPTIIKQDGKVGIGTTTPSELLDVVNGNIKANSNIYTLQRLAVGNSNPNYSLDVSGKSRLKTDLYIDGDSTKGGTINLCSRGTFAEGRGQWIVESMPFGFSNNFRIAKYDCNNIITANNSTTITDYGFMRIGGEALAQERLHVSNGNVKIDSNLYVLYREGIATSNPSEALDVNGHAKISSNIYILSRIGVGLSNPAYAVDIQGDIRLSGNIYQGGSSTFGDSISIQSNLGIGTNTPVEAIQVAIGNVQFDSNLYVMNRIGVSTKTPSEALDISNGGNAKISSNLYTLKKQSIGHSNPTESLDIIGNLKLSNNLYTLNRIGIATSNPQVALEINTTDAILLPNGTTAQRPSVPKQGHVRYNSSFQTFEGYGAGNAWGSLGGVKDTNQDTYISAESAPTANDDILRFYNSNNETMRITLTGRIGISNQAPSERLELSGGNAKFNSNVYILNYIGIATSNPQVSLEINTTDAILLPNGTTAQRPSVPKQGHVRYNSSFQTFEGYGAGNAWGSLGGVKDTNQDTYISAESAPTANDDILRFYNSNNETMRITLTGRIGISNQAPSERLELSGGNAKFNSNVYVITRLSVANSNPTEPLDITGNIKVSNNLYTLNRIGISTSNPQVSLEINTTDAVLLPNGTTAQRPSVPATGHIRYNSSFQTFEGYGAGNAWGSLGGVKDTNQDTYISAESAPTANDDILRFYNSNNETMRITLTGRIGISNQAPSERLELSGGNAKFNSNVYILNYIGIATSNPQVALEINTTDAILLPNGTTAQRPSVPKQGHIRYNSSFQTFEGYGAGNAWGSLGGVKDTNQDTYISAESAPTANDDILRFYNSNNETMRIMPTGRIGISNQAPSERLELSGGNAKFNSNVYVITRLSVANSNPTEPLDITGNIKVSNNLYTLNRIGIATSNPQVALEINTTDAVLLPNGTTAQRPSVPTTGHIRYNSSFQTFEGYGAGNAWGSLGGVKDTNQDTYISAESAPTANDDILRFYNSNNETMRITLTGRIGISNQTPSERLELSGGNAKFNSNVYVVNRLSVANSNPTESLDITGNIKVSNNLYTLNRIGISTSNPQVALEINTTDAILLPNGTTAQRPSVPKQGHVRYNSSFQTFEGYGAGNAWGSLGGVKDTNQDTYISAESAPTANDDILRFYNSNNETMRIMATGRIGISNQAPSERLELSGGNAKFNSNIYISSRIGVGTSNPLQSIHTTGNIRATNGTLGPMLMLIPPIAYTDVIVNDRLVLDNTLEAGNEVSNNTWKPLFFGNGFLFKDTSGESMSWTEARLIFRGMALTQSSPEFTSMVVQDFVYSRTPQYSNISSSFTIETQNVQRGYLTNTTPWFTMSTTDTRHLAVYVSSSTTNSTYRFGSVYIQFRG